ncbi:MAG: EndoU domain-containing protein [Flavobacteriaceae bacterium]
MHFYSRPASAGLFYCPCEADTSTSSAAPTLPDISAAVSGAAAGNWPGTLAQGAGRAARQAAPVLGKGAAAVLGKVLFFLSPILDATETGGPIDREVTINGIRARVTGFSADRSRTFEIEIDGRTFRFNGSTNRDGDIVAGAGYEIIDGEPVPLADFAESWNRLVEHAPAGSGLAMVAQSQSAGGEDDDEEEEGKPTTGEGAEDPPMDMGGENPLTPQDGQEPQQDPENNRPPSSGGPPPRFRLPKRDPSDGIGPDDDKKKGDPQDGNPTAPDGTAKEPERQRQSREEAKPIAYLYGGFPIYNDQTAPLPDPNDQEDPFWVRTDRDLPARVIQKVLDGKIVHYRSGERTATYVYGGQYAAGLTVEILETLDIDDRGVREARIKIYDVRSGLWYTKPKKTTLFPKRWSRARVMYEARMALENATHAGGSLWRGRSPSGIIIEFFREPNGEIGSFYPLLRTK